MFATKPSAATIRRAKQEIFICIGGALVFLCMALFHGYIAWHFFVTQTQNVHTVAGLLAVLDTIISLVLLVIWMCFSILISTAANEIVRYHEERTYLQKKHATP